MKSLMHRGKKMPLAEHFSTWRSLRRNRQDGLVVTNRKTTYSHYEERSNEHENKDIYVGLGVSPFYQRRVGHGVLRLNQGNGSVGDAPGFCLAPGVAYAVRGGERQQS